MSVNSEKKRGRCRQNAVILLCSVFDCKKSQNGVE